MLAGVGEENLRPAELVSQAHCTAAPTALALWATEAGRDKSNNNANFKPSTRRS